MSKPHYVMHDGKRWRVIEHTSIDDDPAYQLLRRDGVVFARVRECDPDAHEPIRTIRDSDGVLRWNTRRRTFSLSVPRGRKRFTFTMRGLLTMAARAEANRRALEKEHRRRIRGR